MSYWIWKLQCLNMYLFSRFKHFRYPYNYFSHKVFVKKTHTCYQSAYFYRIFVFPSPSDKSLVVTYGNWVIIRCCCGDADNNDVGSTIIVRKFHPKKGTKGWIIFSSSLLCSVLEVKKILVLFPPMIFSFVIFFKPDAKLQKINKRIKMRVSYTHKTPLKLLSLYKY